MKKIFIFLPLASLILTACSSNDPAPVVSATGSNGGELAPSLPQPVNTGSTGWQSDVQPMEMPSTMSQPMPQPVYNAPAPQPVYNAPAPQPVAKQKPAPTPKPVAKKVPQNFEIPRDENNAPIYSQIEKGFYNGDSYTVRKGDTMFLIAYIAGKDVKEIARLNNMSEPYQLRVGQSLKLGNSNTASTTPAPAPTPEPAPVAPPKPVEPPVTYTQGANGTTYSSTGDVTGPVKASTGSEEVAVPNTGVKASVGTAPVATGVVATTGSTVQATTVTSNTTTAPPSNIKWQWPTAGRVIAGYSASEGGNKGLDIAGSKGQDVVAAAPGKVVYAGNALEGYGNLIIIKHSDDFLSAYAHNDSIKVDEQDTVKAGEKIATLGSTGTNTNKLHFEIRYKGKSIDPARYLPKR